MKTKEAIQRNISKRLGVWVVVITAVLMVPLLTRSPWTAGDYIFAAIVLFGLANIYEFSTRNMKKTRHRAVVGAGVLLIIFLIMGWAAAGP